MLDKHRDAAAHGSAAQKARSGHMVDGPIEVEVELCIDAPRRDGMYLLEEAQLLVREWDQILSLLWIEEGLRATMIFDDRDDNGGLEELDGILPWPSKKEALRRYREYDIFSVKWTP